MNESEIKSHIGKLLYAYREAKGLKRREVGLQVNLTQKMVRLYEKGTSAINIIMLLKFAEVLDIPKEKFFDFVKINDFVEDCKTRIKKNREILDIIDEYPELKEAVKFYGKHANDVRKLNLPGFLKKYTQIPELERDSLTVLVNKLSVKNKLLTNKKKEKV